MTRLLIPIIIIGVAIGLFYMFASPIYTEITNLKTEALSYDEALTNAKALEAEKNKLTEKRNAMNPDDLAKLQKLLPENVDNVRLILEIEQVAAPYGMTLKDVKYNSSGTGTSGGIQGGQNNAGRNDYGIFELGFSVVGTYQNFLNFVKDLERNLRVVDIASLNFSSDTGINMDSKNPSTETYKYDITIRTYWLKN